MSALKTLQPDTNMRKKIALGAGVIILGLSAWYIPKSIASYRADPERAAARAREEAINRVLETRRAKVESDTTTEVDPIGKDGIARVLLIGLDKRVGQTAGHCDVIQMIEINKKKQEITITAVPRGTYAPLPPGVAATTSDYYVSNSCGLVGIEYGINQIEKIVGAKADYLVIVGFSETLGILRTLKLPTTETLQWLRQRHVYAIGEPQRARNHSTFIKQMLIKYIPEDNSKIDTALQYIIYKIVKTDLSFAEAEALVKEISAIDVMNHPERIQLAMRPAYAVQDIPYIPEKLTEYLEKTLNPIKNYLSKNDYSGASGEKIQEGLLIMIEDKKNDDDFILWAYENNLWLQVEDDAKRLEIQFDVIKKYIALVPEETERRKIVEDYILEMEHTGEAMWVEKGKELLASELGRMW